MRFVTVKDVEQAAVKARTAQVNQIRGLLAEYGIVVAKGVGQRRALPGILEDAHNGLSELLRLWLAELYEQLRQLDERIKGYDVQINALFARQEACQRIAAVEGIGPLSATALVSTFGDGRQFNNARQFAAALGLVPRQHGTGDKTRLLGISKRGDRYIRTLLVHGARSVVQAVLSKDKEDARSPWIRRIAQERGKNRAAVALARIERRHEQDDSHNGCVGTARTMAR